MKTRPKQKTIKTPNLLPGFQTPFKTAQFDNNTDQLKMEIAWKHSKALT